MNETFPNVRSAEANEALASVSTRDLSEELRILVRRKGATRLERRMTELEKAQISERIKTARVQAGLTQEELADLLHVRARTIANYEADRVPWRLLDKIAEFTGVSQQWLLHGIAASEPDAKYEQILARLESLEKRLDAGSQQTADALARLEEAISKQSSRTPVAKPSRRRAQ